VEVRRKPTLKTVNIDHTMSPHLYSQIGSQISATMRRTSRPAVLLVILIGTVIGMSGCAVNPITGKSEVSWISEAEEISIGDKQYLPSRQSQGGDYLADPEINRYINEVGNRVTRAGDRYLPYEFVVLNNSVPNAWALPGGKIAINRGLLLELKNEAELAAVLGHEAVHAAAKHGANSMQRSQLIQGIVLATQLSTADLGYGNYIVEGAQLGAQLINHRYSRGAELEADYYGIKFMSRAGYEPRAAVSLQETFMRLSESPQSSWVGGLFASHPPSQARVQANIETIRELQLPAGDTYQDHYQQKIAYLVETKPAYDKYDLARTLSQNNELDSALESVDQAIKLVPEEALFHGLQGNIHYQQTHYKKATAAYNRALKLDDSYFEYYLGRGLTNRKLGKLKAARKDFQRSNQLLPTAVANRALDELSIASED